MKRNNSMDHSSLKIAYFGTPEFSVIVLDELKKAGIIPTIIITGTDKPVGRKYVMTPPPVKVWAQEEGIEYLQPHHPKEVTEHLAAQGYDLFIVASYGSLLSQKMLDIPRYGVLNVHTSLLPLYRGASPIETALLNNDEQTGSTIMKMSLGMDEGPILAQSLVTIHPTTTKPELFDLLAHDGGRLLAETIPEYIAGRISEQEQDHSKATYTKKIEKSDGDITNDEDQTRWNKYRAYYGWPGVFFFEEGKRIKVTQAMFVDGTFVIQRVIPEGKSEMEY